MGTNLVEAGRFQCQASGVSRIMHSFAWHHSPDRKSSRLCSFPSVPRFPWTPFRAFRIGPRWRAVEGLPSVVAACERRPAHDKTLKYYGHNYHMKPETIRQQFTEMGAGNCFGCEMERSAGTPARTQKNAAMPQRLKRTGESALLSSPPSGHSHERLRFCSLAIANGLEERCEIKAPEPKKKRA